MNCTRCRKPVLYFPSKNVSDLYCTDCTVKAVKISMSAHAVSLLHPESNSKRE